MVSMVYSVVIVGLGDIALGYDEHHKNAIFTHYRAMLNDDRFSLRAGVDLDITKRRRFAKNALLPTYERMSELDFTPDIIVISTPTHTHFDIFREAMALKPKLILLEKPISNHVGDIERMQSMIDENNTIIMVNLFRLYMASLNRYLSSIDKRRASKARVTYTKGLLHNGIHFITLLIRHFGPINRAYANGSGEYVFETESLQFVMHPAMDGVEDNSIVLTHSNGSLYYLAGGRNIIELDKNGREMHTIDDVFLTYQKPVYERMIDVMNGSADDSWRLACDGQYALADVVSSDPNVNRSKSLV